MNVKEQANTLTKVKTILYIDAGVEHLHLHLYRYEDGGDASLVNDISIKNNDEIEKLFKDEGVFSLIEKYTEESEDFKIYITGKLADITRNAIKGGSYNLLCITMGSWSEIHEGNRSRLEDLRYN